jgi:2-keto-4-pentenoate hydratase/2-oxohepta-3-ene-1,7-dioic acid hydratase in catechol pathway
MFARRFIPQSTKRLVSKCNFSNKSSVPVPPTLYAIGLNYKAHAEETGKESPRFPIVISLATTSVIGHNEKVIVPLCAQDPLEIDYEVELGIVISKDCKNVPIENALEYVEGFTVANDISARRWQGKKGGGQWSRAKSFDTFTPLGPRIVKYNDVIKKMTDNGTLNLNIETKVNGIVKQSSNTNDMIFNVRYCKMFIFPSVCVIMLRLYSLNTHLLILF